MHKKNFKRKDLAEAISKKIGLSKNFSLSFVDNFFNILIEDIIKSKKIKISTFGTFDVISKRERIGRNPKTKVETKITSRKVVRFKPSPIFKNKINNKDES